VLSRSNLIELGHFPITLVRIHDRTSRRRADLKSTVPCYRRWFGKVNQRDWTLAHLLFNVAKIANIAFMVLVVFRARRIIAWQIA
jgi:hypothetical protein